MRYENQTYVGIDIELESHEWIGCSFQNCRLIYRGGTPVLDYNSFEGCRFDFDGPAFSTLSFMRLLYRSGGASIIDGIFKSIAATTDMPFFSGNDKIH